jgi:hypothetical protein
MTPIPYDNANVGPWFNGLTASDLIAWANDLSSNWISGWTSRFILTATDIATLNAVFTGQRDGFIASLADAANELNSGRTIDRSGLNVSGGGHWLIHLNTVWAGLFPTLSIWWVHIP